VVNASDDSKTGPVRFISPINRPEDGGYPGLQPQTLFEDGLRIDRDVEVPLRDGSPLFVDVYRPGDTTDALAPLIAWSPYGKHSAAPARAKSFLPAAGIDPAWGVSRHAATEAPDPVSWCPHGYAIVVADPRGTWGTPGRFTMGTRQEAEDFYDVIEWAGTQHWSNGKVGTTGASYLGIAQWRVAALAPPHLAAINPWEGLNDFYREIFYHGGIPETRFIPLWATRGMGYARLGDAEIEDIQSLAREHPLWDEYWEAKDADLSAVDVPAYVVAGWSSHCIHLRGTLEAYKQIAGERTWLELHGQKIWQHYYDPRSVENQRSFFNWALKGEDSGWLQRPRVQLQVRDHGPVGEIRPEAEWPLARTQYRQLYLDARSAALAPEPVAEASHISYDTAAPVDGAAPARATFVHVFEQDTELTGHMKLRVWVEVDESDDADLFVAVQKLGKDGRLVGFPFIAFRDDGPVALGWLRASHRELDGDRSTPQQPWHPHTREAPLEPGVPVPVDIELWPSSTRFAAGEALRLVVQGSDVYAADGGDFGHEATRNVGGHVIHTGGRYDSHLLVPVIPPTEE
jgi:predicted acyl esterase